MRILAIALALAACRNGDPAPTPRDDVAEDSRDFAAVDEVFGGDGLIRGFDPAKVIGKSPASLKQALPNSFEIGSNCNDVACTAQGPRMPGERFPLRVDAMREFVDVRFDLHGPRLLHLYSRLEAALGGSEIIDSKTRVFTHDSLRYLMSANPVSWGVTIKITRDDSNDFAALDQMFGGDGLIRGFDPAKVVGKSPASLKKALASSFTIDSICDEDACAAEAPLPGGKKVRIGVVRAWGGNVAVSLELDGPQLLHVYSRLETALGGSEMVDKKSTSQQTRVYTHDALRYVMRATPSTRAVTVKITKIDDAERFFD